MPTLRKFSYEDKEIIVNGRIRYLRIKRGLRHNKEYILSIRTHRNGKGIKLWQVKGTVYSEEAYISLLHKLNKKIKFKFLILQDIPTIEKDK